MGKKAQKITFYCEICNKMFQVPASDHRIKEGKKIRFCSRKCMGVSNKKGEYKHCKYCEKLFYTTRNIFCSSKCACEYKKVNYNHKTYYENGYICEYHNGYNKKGNVKQHRRIMEEYIGRKLKENEIVHHKNGDKTDNRIDNLQIMTRSEHSSMHRKEEKKNGKHLFGGYHNN